MLNPLKSLRSPQTLLLALVAYVCMALMPLPALAASDNHPVVVLAHMVNSLQAVDWAVEQGANGVEMDLRFASDSTPLVFRHSQGLNAPCDCTASAWGDDHVCEHLGNPPEGIQKKSAMLKGQKLCFVEADANEMLTHLASKDSLAVVYIDSKVDGSDFPNLGQAGIEVVKALDEYLFGNGYGGQVIIGAPKIGQTEYLRMAEQQGQKSPYKDRYFFTIDGEGEKFEKVMDTLISISPNRVYATGITSLAPGSYDDAIYKSAYNQTQGVLGGTGIWTIDDPKPMKRYLTIGADMLMTNRPGAAVSVVKELGLPLARPGSALKTATSTALSKLPANTPCESNNNCLNNACGRGTAADNAPKVCCPSGQITNYAGYDYCKQMPSESVCWSDAMCASGTCKGNKYGLQKGKCQ